ncbi:MAG: hypothetical protein ACLR8X_08710 [Gallintestinimicrobium sp.]
MKEFYITDDGIQLHAKLDMPEEKKVPAGYCVSWFNRQYGGTAHHCCFKRNE